MATDLVFGVASDRDRSGLLKEIVAFAHGTSMMQCTENDPDILHLFKSKKN